MRPSVLFQNNYYFGSFSSALYSLLSFVWTSVCGTVLVEGNESLKVNIGEAVRSTLSESDILWCQQSGVAGYGGWSARDRFQWMEKGGEEE